MSENMRQILIVNGGSSSVKLSLLNHKEESNAPRDPLVWTRNLSSNLLDSPEEQVENLLRESLEKEKAELDQIVCVGHRVVHGGAKFVQTIEADTSVEREIEELSELAPVHNPIAVKLIRAARKLLPQAKQIAAFDTAFHATIKSEEYIYPLPFEWFEKYGIRRFGFHGINHQYCSRFAKELMKETGKPAAKIVNIHLGNGCSVAAIRDGASVDTSMGFTPLEGLMMGARSGSIDPGIIFFLMQEKKFLAKDLDKILNNSSGLLGVSGLSKDMREIEKSMSAGDKRATLAFEIFVRRVRASVAAMAASLNGIDVLVFTAGIGEHSSRVRESVAQGLEFLGLSLQKDLNENCKQDGIISSENSRVTVMRITAREDLQIYDDCKSFVGQIS